METWLKDHLIRGGHLTESGLSRKARIRRCATCRAEVLTGLDADQCAFEVAADPIPLSPIGEVLAVAEGRRTLTLRRAGGRWELDARSSFDIAGSPAGSGEREDVLRQHRCRTPDPTGVLTAPSTFPETKPPAPAGATPPF